MVDSIKRDISDLRFGQTETDRRTQDSLEAVHNTLGHVVDRLAMIEGDLRGLRAAPAPAAGAAPPRLRARRQGRSAEAPVPPPPRGDAAASGTAESRRRPPSRPRRVNSRAQAPAEPAPAPSRSLNEILDPRPPAARRTPRPRPSRAVRSAWRSIRTCRPIIRWSRAPGRPAVSASPSERIAASESAISDIPRREDRADQLVELHRRRAPRRAGRRRRAPRPRRRQGRRKKKPAAAADPAAQGPGSTLGSKIRSLLVGVSVVVIVLGTFKMAMKLLDGDSPPPPAAEQLQPAASPLAPPSDRSGRAARRRRRRRSRR